MALSLSTVKIGDIDPDLVMAARRDVNVRMSVKAHFTDLDRIKIVVDAADVGFFTPATIDGNKRALGVFIAEAERQKGYAYEALQQYYGAADSIARIREANTAGQALFTKLGFSQTGEVSGRDPTRTWTK